MLTRRIFVGASIALAVAANAGTSPINGGSRPVIMDTDIGDDIDDT